MTPAARIRDHISEHQDLKGWTDLNHPSAMDLCAESTAELHDELHGVASALAGPRPEKYFREQLRGEKPLTLLDLCRLSVTAPRAVGRLLAPIARACGYEMVPTKARPTNLHQAIAAVAATQGKLIETATLAAEDGVIDDSEGPRLDAAIRAAEEQLAQLKAAKERGR